MSMCRTRGNLNPPDFNNPKQCFNVPTLDNKELEFATVPVNTSPQKALDAEQYVARSVSDLGTISSDDKDISTIVTFIEGSEITCTLYTQLKSDAYGRSTYNTFSETINPIHQQYRKINNFKMKLKDSVSFDYVNAETKSGIQGEAVLYPFFCPYQGDMFIYETGTNKLGLFKITEPPTRLAINSMTCHEIKFILITWVTDEILEKLNTCVVDEVYFDLNSYMGNAGAFLTSDEAKLMSDVRKAIAVLTHRYVADYYEDKIYRTFIENMCLYDPYIVEFCLRLFESKDLPGYPHQLKPHPKHWTESFWHMLLDPDYTPEEIVVKMAVKLNYGVNYRTAEVTALTNKCYIELEKDLFGTKPYPPFVIPKKFDKEEVTVPMQVRLYLSERKVFPAALLALAKEMLTVRRIAGFYFIPIVIFFLKKLLSALETGNQNMIYADPDDKQQDQTCICDCSDCIFSCNPPHMKSMPKCPGHAHHQCSFKSDCNTIYLPPCGGCRTDMHPYPDMYTDKQTTTKSFWVDIRSQEDQRMNPNLPGIAPCRELPPFGPHHLPIQCDHPVMNPYPYDPCATCPCPPSPSTPYEDPEEEDNNIREVNLIIHRPEEKENLTLVVQCAVSGSFDYAIELIDTSKAIERELSGDLISVKVNGMSWDRPVRISPCGIPPMVDKVRVKIRGFASMSALMYRYQWYKLDGTGLGWVVY